MFDFGDPETLWLNITNLGLGIVTLAALLGLGTVITKELLGRLTLHVPSSEHELLDPQLGLTMADGGEPIRKEQSVENGSTQEPTS